MKLSFEALYEKTFTADARSRESLAAGVDGAVFFKADLRAVYDATVAALAAGTEPTCKHGKTEAHTFWCGDPRAKPPCMEGQGRGHECSGPTRAEAMHAGTITGPEPALLTDSEIGALKVALDGDEWAQDDVGETLRGLLARAESSPAQQAPAATGVCEHEKFGGCLGHEHPMAPAATGDDALADDVIEEEASRRFYGGPSEPRLGRWYDFRSGAVWARDLLRARPLPTREQAIRIVAELLPTRVYGRKSNEDTAHDIVDALFAPGEAKP